MNKKGLSILLALSMVFSLNSMAFAEEAVVTEEAVVAASEDVEVTQSQDYWDYTRSLNKYKEQTSFAKDKSITISGADLTLTSYASHPGVAYYKGKKLTGSDLGLWLENKEGYSVAVKNLKLTGSNKKSDARGKVTFTLKSIGSFKDVEGPTGRLTEFEAKAAYKSLKASFKNAKSQEITAYIAPSYVTGTISEAALKTLKKAGKTLSQGEIGKLGWGVGESPAYTAAYLKVKNGNVKSVQIAYLDYKYISKSTGVYKVKVKTRKLKKGEYTVSGSAVTLNDSDAYTSEKPLEAK